MRLAARSFPLGNAFRSDGFSLEQIPDLARKVMIVTGGNCGLGKASVEALYRRNAHVILASKSLEKGEAAKTEILSKAKGTGKIEVMQLDLSEMRNVRRFAEEFKAKSLPLHVLMLNAGVFNLSCVLSADGIESNFAVNHVGHHLLAQSLLGVLKESAPSRVVVLSSDGMDSAPAHGVGTNLEQIKSIEPVRLYGQSKLANFLFSRELAKRTNGSGVIVNAVHPGGVATSIFRDLYSQNSIPTWVRTALPKLITSVGYTAERAALTQLYAATAPELEEKNVTGEYFVPIARPSREFTHPQAKNQKLQQELWEFTESLIL